VVGKGRTACKSSSRCTETEWHPIEMWVMLNGVLLKGARS
jgi:hypothetical protein